MSTLTAVRSDLAEVCASVGDLAPISLAELVERAARLTRVDRKYVVPAGVVPVLVGAVAEAARALEIAGRRDFGYRSTYFDTPDLRSYYEGGRGRRRRWKVRTRTYLDCGDQFIEVKTAGPRGTTVKSRMPLSTGEDHLLGRSDRAFVTEGLARAGVGDVDPVLLQPTLVTAYRRSTLLLLGADGHAERVTIDTGLGWSTTNAAPRDVDRPSLAIVETKAGSTPTLMDHTLWQHGHRPVRISKYGTGLAALTPGLPHLKWHRMLSGPLAATSARAA